MARIDIPFTQLSRLGDDMNSGATTFDALGAMFHNKDAQTVLALTNNGAGQHTITFTTPFLASGGLTVEDPTVTIEAGETLIFGNFDPVVFNQVSGPDIGKVYVDSDATQSEVVGKLYRP